MQEIKQCMFDLAETKKGEVTARCLFPADFIGFQGHFPKKPVLPGVCKIQAVTVMLQTWEKRKFRLKEIVLAKFFSPVSPEEELIFNYRKQIKSKNEALIKTLIISKDKKVAELQLRVGTSHGN
jgi:3-hydroxyacyl-[acyl-carrier-protein] dehydratase